MIERLGDLMALLGPRLGARTLLWDVVRYCESSWWEITACFFRCGLCRYFLIKITCLKQFKTSNLKLCRYRTLPRSELWEKAVAGSQAQCYFQACSIDHLWESIKHPRSGRPPRFNDAKSVLGVTHLVLRKVMQRFCEKLWTYCSVSIPYMVHTWSHLLTPGLAAAAHSISGFAKSRGWIATGH